MSKSKRRRSKSQHRSIPKSRSRSQKSLRRKTLGVAVGLILIIVSALIVVSVSSSVPRFDGARALLDVQKLVDLGPRVPGTLAHRNGLDLLRTRLDSLADQLTLQPVWIATQAGDTIHGTNVIASFNLQPERNVRVMLGAHWDSRPFADRDPDPNRRGDPVPGANDGASGTAVLLEMARLLNEQPPEIGVDLLLFDLEDAGVDSTVPFAAGSEQFAAENTHYRPTFGIIVDMVCDHQLRLARESNSVQAAKRIVDLVWNTAEEIGAAGFVDVLGGSVNDDHIPFLRRGIPVIDLIQLPFPDYWHTTADTPEKCSAESLEQVGSVLSAVVYSQ